MFLWLLDPFVFLPLLFWVQNIFILIKYMIHTYKMYNVKIIGADSKAVVYKNHLLDIL